MSFADESKARQLIDFVGVEAGTGYPTDIDGIIEYHNKGYVLMEVKHRNTKLKKGQRLCLERMCDDFIKAKKHAIVIVAEHVIDKAEDNVMLKECFVREYYTSGRWVTVTLDQTVREIVREFCNYIDKF